MPRIVLLCRARRPQRTICWMKGTNRSSRYRRSEQLGEDECLQLLTQEHIGRLGLSSGALPVILPVNYVVDGRRIVFATEAGLKLDAARSHTVACLEVDGFDAFDHAGWSVIATGRLGVVDGDERARSLPVSPWASEGVPYHIVELRTELLSGRRVGAVPGEADDEGTAIAHAPP